MKLVAIETFVAVATLHHFRKAADRLNTTQPNVSARISELEKMVGGALFSRQRGKVALTPLGRHMLPFAEKILESIEDFSAQSEINVVREGKLTLALSETIVNTLLPPFIQAFSQAFPNVTVDLVVDTTTNQRRELLERTVDVACLLGPISEYEVVNLPLIQLPLIWTAAPQHPATQVPELDAHDLARWPIISYAGNSRPFKELKAAFQQAKTAKPRFFRSDSLNATLAMTRSKLGISTLPEVFARPFLESGELVELRSSFSPGILSFTVSYTDDPLNSLAKAAADIAVSVARQFVIDHSVDQK